MAGSARQLTSRTGHPIGGLAADGFTFV